jgi:hypothetical protein
VQDNLRQTLLFASALQVLGPNHKVSKRLESTVRKHGGKLIVSAQQLVDELPRDQREKFLQRYDYLCRQLPDEALAA